MKTEANTLNKVTMEQIKDCTKESEMSVLNMMTK